MKGMTSIVKITVDILKGLIILFGIYIVLYGHLSPGGGFSGGVVIAIGFILITLAHGKNIISKKFAKRSDSLAAISFLLIATIALFIGKPFFENYLMKLFKLQPFQLITAGTIPIYNIVVGIKVSSSLFLIFIFISSLRFLIKDNEIIYEIEEEEEE